MGTSLQERQTGQFRHIWCAYGDGTRHGPSVRIDEDEFIVEEGGWEMGLRHGPWQRFAKTGERTAAGSYSQGERVGSWTNFDPETGWMLGRYFDVLHPPELPRSPVAGTGWLWWSMELIDAPIRLVPVGSALLIYSESEVLGVELVTGEPIFQIPLQDRPKADLVIDQARVGFVTEDGGVSIADLEHGSVLQLMSSDAITGIIALEEEILVIRDRSGAVSSIDLEQGRRLWVSKGPWGRVGPLFSSGMLVGVQDRYVHQIDPETGLRGWRTRLGGRLVELVVSYGGESLFALDRDGGLHALELETGRLLWSNEELLLEDVKRGAQLRDDQDALVVTNGTELLRVNHKDGSLIDRVQIDSDDVGRADLLGEMLCIQGPGQGLVCEEIHGAFSWSLDLDAESLPPLILDRLILSLQENNELLAIDRLSARVSGDLDSDIELDLEDIELLLDPEWVGDELTGGWAGESVPARWIEARDKTDECGERRVYLDLGDVGRSLVGREAMILDLELESSDLDSLVEPSEPWTLEILNEIWVIDLLAEWSPRIVQIAAFSRDEQLADLEEALYRCALDGLEFEGSIEVQDGPIRRRYDGSIEIYRVPDLDPAQGCLVELHAGHEDLGIWSTPLGGRVWLRLAGVEEPPLESIEALVLGQEIDLQEEGVEELEIWFGNSGSPWVLEPGELPSMISELSWPEAEEQGFLRWEFDVDALLPAPNSQGLVPLLQLSGCIEEEPLQ